MESTETISPHRHRFDTNSDRTERTCQVCAVRQVKVSGKWKAQRAHLDSVSFSIAHLLYERGVSSKTPWDY